MAQPWKHPKTGVYWFRRVVPKADRERVGKVEVRFTLGTKDPREAKARYGEAIQRYEALIAGAPARHVRLNNKEALALIGKWYREELEFHEDDPGEPIGWEAPAELIGDAIEEDRVPKSVEEDLDRILDAEGLKVTAETRNRLLPMLAREKVRLYYTLAARADNDYRPDQRLDEFPRWEAKAKPVTFGELWTGWKAVAAAGPRSIEDTRRHLAKLEAFLGHDHASLLTADDLRGWREKLKAQGLSNNTWNNVISLIGQVLLWGVQEGKLSSNVADGLRLRRNKRALRLGYDDEQAAAILNAARQAKRPSVRWAHWLMAFSGMRVGEALQLYTTDVRQDGSVHYISINEDDPGKTVKNSVPRNVPIHAALIQEGFLEFVRGRVDPKAPQKPQHLFPDKKPDRFGLFGGDAWKITGRFVRQTVGITDERIAPDHSWRHRMADQLRGVESPKEVRDAILGHAEPGVGRVYGAKGEALRKLDRYLQKVKVPKGVEFR